jgi:tRNA-splicing ligase RtcB
MSRPNAPGAPIHRWVCGPIDALARRQIELLASLPDVTRVVVLPDAHAGSHVCNGCVIATQDLIYPDAVGRDIGCGYAAAQITGDASWCDDPGTLREVLGQMGRAIGILKRRGGAAALTTYPPDPEMLSVPSLRSAARRDGAVQLGTLGRGNHFVEIQREAGASAWLMVHSGSRAMGESIHSYHTKNARIDRCPLPALSRATPEGTGYLRDAAWATAWASANRARIIELVHEVLVLCVGSGMVPDTQIDSPHNTISIERHGGVEVLVHRKSAARAVLGEPLLIAGSAGTFSVHASGLGCDRSLHSAAHGAGRAHSRREAAARFGPREVTRQYGRVIFDTTLVPRLRDESPGSYRDLRPVLECQRELARVTRRLKPVLNFKGV